MPVLIEGYTEDELLTFEPSEFDAIVFTNEPIVFHAGSAEILGRFKLSPSTITIELAHIDGGGEGVLPTLGSFTKRLAHERGVNSIEWIVHAVTCANPNPKLKAVLARRGFTVRNVEGSGDVYYQLEDLHR